MKFRLLGRLLALTGLIWLTGPALAGGLFSSAQGAADAVSEPWVKQARNVGVNVRELLGVAPGDELGLNLFTGVELRGRVQKIEPKGAQRIVLSGVLGGKPGSQFVLAVNRDVVVGTIKDGRGREYAIRHTSAGHQIQAIDSSGYPACGTDHEHRVSGPEVQLDFDMVSDDGSVFDVMVVYTPNARAAVGGTVAMQALIDLAVAETNNAYQQSGINTSVNLVHTYEVAYNTSGDFSTDLNRVTGKTDGYMDEVHAVRDQYNADLVSLIINNSQYCGIAWLMSNLSLGFESSAFSVVHHDCATGYYSFGHELGHNAGSAHDRANAGSALYPYSYGWRFYGNNSVQYRTVMAYSPGLRVDRFSNPNVAYQGTATGTLSDDNARSINNAALTVANFRQSSAPSSLATYSNTTNVLWIGNTQIVGGGNLDVEFRLFGNAFWLTSMGPATTAEVGATYDSTTGALVVPNGDIIESGETFDLELLYSFGRKFDIVNYSITP